MNQDFLFTFQPLDDINVFELALLFAAIGVHLRQQAFDSLSPEMKRHFIRRDAPFVIDEDEFTSRPN